MQCLTNDPPSNPKDPYYHCLCGIHVHSFIYELAILEIFLGIVTFIGALSTGYHWVAVPVFGGICLSILLLWGNRTMTWWAYIWEIIQWVITAGYNFVIFGFLLGYGVVALFADVDLSIFNEGQYVMEHDRSSMIAAIIITSIVQLVFSLVFVYFTSVVLRGFQYCYKFGRKGGEDGMEY